MSLVTDLISRSDAARQRRAYWEGIWDQIVKLCLPVEQAFLGMNGIVNGQVDGALNSGPRSTDRVKRVYDNTAMWCIDRLASGMESLVTPQSEKWHGLGPTDPLAAIPNDEEKEWFARFRDFLFVTRYDPKAGFIAAHQKAIRSCVALGTGLIYIEENYGRRGTSPRTTPMLYRYTPLSESYLATDEYGVVDSNFRRYTLTARQLAQKFGREKLSAKVQQMLDDPTKIETAVECLHAVCPREEAGSKYLEGTVRGSPWASYYIEMETKQLISEGGFFEFPFMVYHWLQQDNGPYAESAVMLALSEIKSLQEMGKNELRAFQQFTNPPLALPSEGVMNRPNLNPRALNYGAMGENGQLRVAPLVTMKEPQFVEQIMDTRRNSVKETLYVNLFQILIKNPEMTATEAMIRANEKGELLGPAGGKIQSGLAMGIDREIGIIERKGAFQDGSPLEPPASLGGRGIGARFTSPLDRLRRANEAIGITRTLETMLPLVKVQPNILDNFNLDKAARHLADIWNAPPDIITRMEDMLEKREQSDKEAQMAKGIAAAQGGAAAAKDGAAAVSDATAPSIMAPQIMDGLNEILQRVRGKADDSGQGGDPATDALLQQFGEAPTNGAAQRLIPAASPT